MFNFEIWKFVLVQNLLKLIICWIWKFVKFQNFLNLNFFKFYNRWIFVTSYQLFFLTNNNYPVVKSQQNLTLKHGVTGTNDSSVKNELYEQVVGLIDLILDGRKCHLESIRGTEKFVILLKQYEAERTNLIQPLSKFLLNSLTQENLSVLKIIDSSISLSKKRAVRERSNAGRKVLRLCLVGTNLWTNRQQKSSRQLYGKIFVPGLCRIFIFLVIFFKLNNFYSYLYNA